MRCSRAGNQLHTLRVSGPVLFDMLSISTSEKEHMSSIGKLKLTSRPKCFFAASCMRSSNALASVSDISLTGVRTFTWAVDPLLHGMLAISSFSAFWSLLIPTSQLRREHPGLISSSGEQANLQPAPATKDQPANGFQTQANFAGACARSSLKKELRTRTIDAHTCRSRLFRTRVARAEPTKSWTNNSPVSPCTSPVRDETKEQKRKPMTKLERKGRSLH